MAEINNDPREKKIPFYKKKVFIVGGILYLILLLGGYFWFGIWPHIQYYFIVGPGTQTAQPADLPKPLGTPASDTTWDKDNLTTQDWLTQAEARKLRTQTNVVNFALLSNGSAKYAKYSMPLNPKNKYGWHIDTIRDRIVTAGLENSTGVVFQTSDNATYHLNINQPFELLDQRNTADQVYMFVKENDKLRLYTTTGPLLVQISLGDAQSMLQEQIKANPNLTFTM